MAATNIFQMLEDLSNGKSSNKSVWEQLFEDNNSDERKVVEYDLEHEDLFLKDFDQQSVAQAEAEVLPAVSVTEPDEDFVEPNDLATHFNLRDAVVYSEIMNTKYF